jgi:hypothetical protein
VRRTVKYVKKAKYDPVDLLPSQNSLYSINQSPEKNAVKSVNYFLIRDFSKPVPLRSRFGTNLQEIKISASNRTNESIPAEKPPADKP